MKTFWTAALLPGLLLAQGAPTVEVVPVVSKPVSRTVRLPGEMMPYQSVAIHPRVTGFVDAVEVDRGSVVKEDQVLARLTAPEMKAQLAEAEARHEAIEAQRVEAGAKLVAEQATYDRMKAAAATPGVVAGNELLLAEKAVDAARARVRALESSLRAARAAVQVVEEMQRYLQITAPFDGVITERRVHPGALAGPATELLFRLEQVSRLRLVAAVPEIDLGGIVERARVSFTVPAHPGETFTGVVARIARSVDVKTRTMPVELDVDNRGGRLAPGMFCEVIWPVERARPSLLVPPTAVVVTTERAFVIRVTSGAAEWVTVSRGVVAGGLVEVFGRLEAGDLVVRRGSDELREGTKVASQQSAKP